MEHIVMETLSSMGKRKMYNTTLDADLIRQIKILAAQLEKRQPDFTQRAVHILLAQLSVSSQSIENGTQFGLQTVEHRNNSSILRH